MYFTTVSKSRVHSEKFTFCSLHTAVPHNVSHFGPLVKLPENTILLTFISSNIIKTNFQKTMQLKTDVPVKRQQA